MSVLVGPRSSRTAGAERAHAGLPQVNLLSPETRVAQAFTRVKRWLVVGLVVVLALVAAAYGAALIQAKSADSTLADAQRETARLTAQQKTYAEVPTVLNKLNALSTAREQAFSTDVQWTPYIYAIFAVMPKDVKISAIEVSVATSTPASSPSADPLQGPSVETIKFAGRTATLPDTAAWVDALNSIPGFQDAWVSSAQTGESTKDGTFYDVQSSVQVTTAAFSHRFAQTGSK